MEVASAEMSRLVPLRNRMAPEGAAGERIAAFWPAPTRSNVRGQLWGLNEIEGGREETLAMRVNAEAKMRGG